MTVRRRSLLPVGRVRPRVQLGKGALLMIERDHELRTVSDSAEVTALFSLGLRQVEVQEFSDGPGARVTLVGDAAFSVGELEIDVSCGLAIVVVGVVRAAGASRGG